jgi:regulator of sigma E protease
MNEFFGSVWWFIVTIGVLVTFHEFGHFWAARRCGVKVLRFSVGFGRALWSRRGRDGTEYQIALLPLGGYVKMLDEREMEVPPAERESTFNRQSVGKRIAITAAGPLANLALCLGLLWAAYQLGVPGFAPVLGAPVGLAAEAGIEPGDQILKVAGRSTPGWDEVQAALVLAAIDRAPVSLEVRAADGQPQTRLLRLDHLSADFDQTNVFAAIGISAGAPLPRVGSVIAEGPASGLIEVGDEVLAVDGQPVRTFADIAPLVQAAASRQDSLRVDLRRDGRRLSVDIRPAASDADGKRIWRLGIGSSQLLLIRYPPVAAMRAAVAETWRQTRTTFAFLGRLITGEASTKNLSGVIGIAQAANAEASLGLGRLLFFMASLSLTLCILNLLPIPVLDGGHLLYYLTELISGRAVSERVLIAGQYAGLALLVGLILLANANDILRLT